MRIARETSFAARAVMEPELGALERTPVRRTS
jgi:hypothetical protein